MSSRQELRRLQRSLVRRLDVNPYSAGPGVTLTPKGGVQFNLTLFTQLAFADMLREEKGGVYTVPDEALPLMLEEISQEMKRRGIA